MRIETSHNIGKPNVVENNTVEETDMEVVGTELVITVPRSNGFMADQKLKIYLTEAECTAIAVVAANFA